MTIKQLSKALMLSFSLMLSSSSYGSLYDNIEEKLAAPKYTPVELEKLAAKYSEELEKLAPKSQVDPALESSPLSNFLVKTGVVQVGVDNVNQPISLGYLSAGNNKINRGTIVCADNYFGRESYRDQANRWALAGFYVVAFDPPGLGQSSSNDPVAMDGIGGFQGYSYQQVAYLYHQALIQLNVNPNTPQTPITYTGVDFNGTVGVLYAYLYQNDPYGLSFLVPENANYMALASDNPCEISLLPIEVAEFIANEFATGDKCALLCSLFGGSSNQQTVGNFTEKNCPLYGAYLANQAVSFNAALSSAIFSRQFIQSFQFDPSPLLAQN